MRISDWSSDVCSSDLLLEVHDGAALDAAACLLADTHDAGHRRAVGARDEAADFAAADIQSGGEAAFHQTDRKSTLCTPVTNAQLVCRLLLEKKNKHTNDQPLVTNPLDTTRIKSADKYKI